MGYCCGTKSVPHRNGSGMVKLFCVLGSGVLSMLTVISPSNTSEGES
uniref:Uncharacterized protein n=1 Tax=Anguilla anguilla TaxID=7936 RepID=A0A0E9SMM9_ANGAN